jgi:hypothetical protein
MLALSGMTSERSRRIDEAIQHLRQRWTVVNQEITEIERGMLGQPGHIDDHDLERYHLGMLTNETELAHVEEHLLACTECVRRAEESALYVDAIRAGLIEGGWDL